MGRWGWNGRSIMLRGPDGLMPGIGAVDMLDRNAVIAIYRNHELATGAVRTAIRCGLDRSRFSLVARDHLAGDRALANDPPGGVVKSWGKLGVFGTNVWGPGLWNLVIGWTSAWVPGIGPLLIGGWMASLMLGSSHGAAVFGHLTPLGAGLYRIGVTKQGIWRYEEAVRRGRYLLIIVGNPDDVTQAGRLLSGTQAEVVALHAHREPGATRSGDRTEEKAGAGVTGSVQSPTTLTGGSHEYSNQVSDHQRD